MECSEIVFSLDGAAALPGAVAGLRFLYSKSLLHHKAKGCLLSTTQVLFMRHLMHFLYLLRFFFNAVSHTMAAKYPGLWLGVVWHMEMPIVLCGNQWWRRGCRIPQTWVDISWKRMERRAEQLKMFLSPMTFTISLQHHSLPLLLVDFLCLCIERYGRLKKRVARLDFYRQFRLSFIKRSSDQNLRLIWSCVLCSMWLLNRCSLFHWLNEAELV